MDATRTNWTRAELAELGRLRAAGETWAAIGSRLGRSVGSVACAYHRNAPALPPPPASAEVILCDNPRCRKVFPRPPARRVSFLCPTCRYAALAKEDTASLGGFRTAGGFKCTANAVLTGDPGRQDRIARYAARAARGEPLFRPEDRNWMLEMYRQAFLGGVYATNSDDDDWDRYSEVAGG